MVLRFVLSTLVLITVTPWVSSQDGPPLLNEPFEHSLELSHDAISARPEQWVSAGVAGVTHWQQRMGADACEGSGYMIVPPTQMNCLAPVILFTPLIRVPVDTPELQFKYRRHFLGGPPSGKAPVLYVINRQGKRQTTVLTETKTSPDGNCELFSGTVAVDLPVFRLGIQSPQNCEGMILDSVELRFSAPENRPSTRINTPEQPELLVARGQSLSFTASTEEGETEGYQFFWQILSRDHPPLSAMGAEVSFSFEHKGIFEVKCVASQAGAHDLTPARRLVRVSNAVLQITDPMVPRRQPLVVDQVNDVVNFEGEVLDPNGVVHQLRWLHGGQPVCTDSTLAGSQRQVSSCAITFTNPGPQAVVFQALNQQGMVMSEQTQLVAVAPKLAGVVVEPFPGKEVVNDHCIDLHAVVLGEFRDHPDNEAIWILEGRVYEGLEICVDLEGHGQRDVAFVIKNPTLNLAHETRVPFFLVEEGRPPEFRIIAPHSDRKIPVGDHIFFAASYGNARESERALTWEITKDDDGSLVASGETAELGKVTFSEAGVYTASLFSQGSDEQAFSQSRKITVGQSQDGGDTPQQPLRIGDGRYPNLRLDKPHYFEVEVPTSNGTIEVNLDFGEGARIEFYPAGQAVLTRCVQGTKTLHYSGLPAGNYTWGVVPDSDCGTTTTKGLKFSFGISVLAPALYFADIAENKEYSTDLGLVNVTGELAEIDIIGYNTEGLPLCSVSREVQPLGSFRETAANIFGDVAESVSWARVDSSNTLVGYARSVSLDNLECFATSAATLLQPELHVPHIAENTSTWYTRASVVNGQNNEINSVMQTREENSSLDNSASFAKDTFDFLDKLGTITSENNWASFQDTDNNATLAGNEIFGTLDGSNQVVGLGLAGSIADNPNFTTGSNSLYFTHITTGSDFWTGLALVNRGTEQQGALINAYGTGGALTGTGTLLLEPSEKVVEAAATMLNLAGITSTDVAWIEVTADANVSGYELFGALSGGSRLAGIEAIDQIRTSLCMPFIDNSGSSWHGIAVVNVSDSEAAVSFTLRNEVGEDVLCIGDEVLAAKEKKIYSLTELFGAIPVNAAWLQVNSDQNLVGFELFGNKSNEFMAGLIAQ